MSALSKKSFSNVNCPDLGMQLLEIRPASGFGPVETWAAPSSNCVFQSVIWLGWMSYYWASSASVRSPFIAASATCALNADEWFRRFLLAMLLLPFKTALAVVSVSKAIAYPPVQFSKDTSLHTLSHC